MISLTVVLKNGCHRSPFCLLLGLAFLGKLPVLFQWFRGHKAGKITGILPWHTNLNWQCYLYFTKSEEMALFRVARFSSQTSPFTWSLLPVQLRTNSGVRYEVTNTSITAKNSEQELISVTKAAGYSYTNPNVFHWAPSKILKQAGFRLLIHQDVWTPCRVYLPVQRMHSCTVHSNANASSKGSSSGRSEQGSVLAKMVNQKGEQKQLTVASKGRWDALGRFVLFLLHGNGL